MEIVPGLHQLRTSMTHESPRVTYAYALERSDGVALFDAGYGTPDATAGMVRELGAIGYEPSDIRQVFISHAHQDHIGMAGWIRDHSPGVEVAMIAREWEWMAGRQEQAESLVDGVSAWARLVDEWMLRHGITPSEIARGHQDDLLGATGLKPVDQRIGPISDPVPLRSPPEILLEDGDIVEFDGWSLQAVWTPGHTPGHLCMFERNHRIMFTGDHVLPRISPNVSLHAGQEGTSPLADYRSSLKKAASFEALLGLPAHEFNITDLRGRCEALLDHHRDRLQEVYFAIGPDGTTTRAVAARVHWNVGDFESFPLRTKRSAIGETLSHLQLLSDEGMVRSRDGANSIEWERT